MTFIEQLKQGTLTDPKEALLDYVSMWHLGVPDSQGMSLQKYLGLNDAQYTVLLKNPDKFYKDYNGINKL